MPNTWSQASAGDHVAFTADKTVKAIGRLALPFIDKGIADHLWGPSSDGRSFQYLLAITDVYSVSMPISGLLQAIGDSGNKGYVQEFRVLGEDASNIAAKHLGLDSEDPLYEFSEFISSDGSTDSEAIVKRRKEHRRLNKEVKSNSGNECALCRRHFATQFLVTAHIKPRSYCTDSERCDFSNIAMAACTLGCDKLYETGMIAVNASGALIKSPLMAKHPTLSQYFDTYLNGKNCRAWTSASSTYFSWHYNHSYRRTATL